MHLSHFYYLSVVGHLDCFHFLVVMTTAAMNMAEYLWSMMSSPLDICQEVVYLSHVGDLSLESSQ